MGFSVKLNNKKPNIEKIGTPKDGNWKDGFFDDWHKETNLADALDDISEIIRDIAPDKADTLTGKNLTRDIVVYNGRLPSGLSDDWYTKISAGGIISGYTIEAAFKSDMPINGFRSGKFKDPSTYGLLELFCNGAKISEYDIANGIGNNGIIYVTNIEMFNQIWAKTNGRLQISFASPGFSEYFLSHGEAGKTNSIAFYFDSEPGELAFEEPLIAVVISESTKYLSGVKYLTTGTLVNVQGAAASGVFKNVYHNSNVAKITGTGVNEVIKNPASIPDINDSFTIDTDIVLNKQNQSSDTLQVDLTFFKPNKSVKQSVILEEPVCTYGVTSTLTSDSFFDEDKRLILNTNSPWNPETVLTNGNAQVKNGALVYGNENYPDKTGIQEYQRKFTKASASTGRIDFSGINYLNISPYGQGDLNVLIQLETDNIFFDLGRPVGDKNGNGSGSNKENSIGGRVSGSGVRVNWSLGTYTTADNQNQYRIIVIFRTNRFSITNMVTG